MEGEDGNPSGEMTDCFGFNEDSQARQLCLETATVNYDIDSEFKTEDTCQVLSEHCEDACAAVAGIRKSSRVPKCVRPDRDQEEISLSKKFKKKSFQRAGIKKQKTKSSVPKFEPNSKPFCCQICKSPYVINPLRRTGKKIKQQASPRHLIHPETRQLLTLCNACGLSAGHKPRKQVKDATVISEDKESYLDAAKRFAETLAKECGDEDAEKLYCPHFKQKGCGCIQNFVAASPGDNEETRNRVNTMLGILKEVRNLAQQKCYDVQEPQTAKGRKHRAIGLGNGQKKSKMFEDFVLQHRRLLRDEWKLCERATQRILCYSNNFLHKKLKTDPERDRRVERQKGKAALGLLVPIEEIYRRSCCGENCVSMAVTHSRLLGSWRERAASGQAEARRVLAEMLTPSGGARCNCYKFISMVTGCSNSTICSVSEQMRKTGGDREPPEHGLKKWWKDHPKARTLRDEGTVLEDDSNSPLENQETSVSQLQLYKMQNLELQKLVTQQQMLLQQRDQLDQQFQPHLSTQVHQAIQQFFQPNVAASNDSSSLSQHSFQVTMPPSLQIKVPTTMANNHGAGNQVLGHSSGLQQLLQNVIFDLPCTDAAGVTVNLNLAMADHAGNILTTNDFSNMTVANVNIILPQAQGESDPQQDGQAIYVQPVDGDFMEAADPGLDRDTSTVSANLDNDEMELQLPSATSDSKDGSQSDFCRQLTQYSEPRANSTVLYNVQPNHVVPKEL